MKLLVFLSIALTAFPGVAQQTSLPILPYPQKVILKEGDEALKIMDSITLPLAEIPKTLNKVLKDDLKFFTSWRIDSISNHVKWIFSEVENTKKDYYKIEITDTIQIYYSSEPSLLYALLSLSQITENKGNYTIIPKVIIEDYSRYSWRGLHLDVSRHFFTVEEIKRYLDLMFLYKLNVFHWHLTDDQGWRIESKKYPKLTQIGAWRDSTVKDHYSTKPRIYSKERYGGYYSQEEIKELVAYAQARNITVVPEIEMPGHSRAALAAYPEYSCTGNLNPVEGLWGVFDDIYCAKDETIAFLQEVLTEYIALFPGAYFHIGGDEAPKTRWKHCENCQKIIKQEGLKDEHELQSYFIKRMDTFLHAQGKKLIGWDEILEGGLSPNATVMSWRGYEGGIEASAKGHEVVMCPGSHCYFDHYQGKSSIEPLAIGGHTPLEKVYEFSPISKSMNEKQQSLVLGAQGNLWTEYIPSMEKLEYMAYPRAIALSQVLWNPDSKPTFEEFENLLKQQHFKWLDKKNVHYAKTNLLPRYEWKSNNQGMEVRFSSKVEGDLFHVILNEPIEINKMQSQEFILANNQVFQIGKSESLDTLSFSIHNEQDGLEQNFSILRHKGLGAKVQFITTPNDQYNSSPHLLTDGQFGKRPWKGHEWIGFKNNKVILEIYLNKKLKINEIELNFLHNPGSWIYSPKTVIASTRKGKKTIQKTVLVEQNSEKISVPLISKARRIKLEILTNERIPEGQPGSGHVPWTFLDEIVVK